MFFKIDLKQIYKLYRTSNLGLQKISAYMVDSFPTKRFFKIKKQIYSTVETIVIKNKYIIIILHIVCICR